MKNILGVFASSKLNNNPRSSRRIEGCGAVSGRSLALVFVVLGFTQILATPNKLTLVEQHLNTNAKSIDLELGTLILYFDRKPALQETHTTNQLIYIFSNAQVAGAEVEAMIKRVNASHPRNYTVRLEKQKKDTLQLIISFDPAQVGVSYAQFPSIKMQHGVIFHMYSKEVLSKINDASHKKILTVAQGEPVGKASVPKIAIDCGHGGSDAGAIGFQGVAEKEITLAVGLELAQILQKNGIQTLLTRNCDSTLSLGNRTTIANTARANAFISIHANSSPQKKTRGIETFCIEPSLLSKQTSSTLSALQLNAAQGFFLSKCNQSEQLAHSIHSHLLDYLTQKKINPIDRHLKHAASQVLLGVHMPAVLIEIGFVTNPDESLLLCQPRYQHEVAQGISNGIMAYLQAQSA